MTHRKLALPAVLLSCAALVAARTSPRVRYGAPSSAVLALLPDSEEKRRFIIDCTGCHQWELARAFPAGRVRSEAEWNTIVGRMQRMAGATTGFPVIARVDTNGDGVAIVALPPHPALARVRGGSGCRRTRATPWCASIRRHRKRRAHG